jgi:hypothetical protein
MVPPEANPSGALLAFSQLNASSARDVPTDDEGLDRLGALEGVGSTRRRHVPDDVGERIGSFRFFFLDRDGPR